MTIDYAYKGVTILTLSDIDMLIDENQRLRAAVEAAFREGWSRKAGMARGIDCGYEIDAAWAVSKARRECER